MKAFYGLMLETQKEERTYQFNAPIGVSFDEVKEVLDLFKSMIEEMQNKTLEKEKQESVSDVIGEEIEPTITIKEDDGTTS